MEIKHISQNEYESILKDHKFVVIDFFADWCGPCQMLSPIINKLVEKHKDIYFCKVNVDQENGLALGLGIASIPTLIFYKDKKPINTIQGYRPLEEIELIIKKTFN